MVCSGHLNLERTQLDPGLEIAMTVVIKLVTKNGYEKTGTVTKQRQNTSRVGGVAGRSRVSIWCNQSDLNFDEGEGRSRTFVLRLSIYWRL